MAWLLLVFLARVSGKYLLSQQGQSCYDACLGSSMDCDPHIVTDDTADIFSQLGANCTGDPTPWWAEDQPSWVTDSKDGNYGKCLGYKSVPGGVLCSAAFPSTRRVCHCVDPASVSRVGAFGTGCSQCKLTNVETTLFTKMVPHGDQFVMNHFWVTAPGSTLETAVFRYYFDGETTPSVEFIPSLASGVGWGDQQAPWGTKWFGKGAKQGAWHTNFKMPFYKSVRVTAQRPGKDAGGFYFIVRGTPQPLNMPLRIGEYVLPFGAKLTNYMTQSKTVPAYEWVPLVDIPSGKGLFFMHTLMVHSVDMNFLEGCYHAYTPHNQTFPGTLLSTGTEDYFDSAWYFDAGQFHLPVSGFTHLTNTKGNVTFSAYRFHEMDALPFEDGFRFVWRNGDVSSGGIKCMTETPPGVRGGVGMVREGADPSSPDFGTSTVTAYAWVYQW